MKTFLSSYIKALTLTALIAAMLCSIQVQAQETHRKVVTLKTSEKFTGTIIEAVPEQYIKLRLDDGTVKTIQADDIQYINDEDKVRRRNRRQERADRRTGLSIIGSMYSGYDLMSGFNYLMFEPSVNVGIRIKRHRIGLGLGFIYGRSLNPNDPAFATIDDSRLAQDHLLYMPVFFNYHGDFGKRKVFASIDVSVGYPGCISPNINYPSNAGYGLTINNIIYQTGIIYADGGPGISVRLAPNLLLNLSAIFHFMQISESNGQGIRGFLTTTNASDTRIIGSAGGALKFIF